MGKIRRICNARIVTPEDVIEKGTVIIEEDRIIGIDRESTPLLGEDDLNADGKWILPGLIDTHSDAIEQEIQPRPTSVMPVPNAFYELERKLAGQGITTMYHSLSLYYSENKGNWVRRNNNVEYIIKKIHELVDEQSLIRNKIHLRYEMRNAEGYSLVEKLIKTNQIHQVSFMDHTPGKGQWHDIGIQKQKIMKQLNLTSEEADQHIVQLQNDNNIDSVKIQQLAELARYYGIPLASHDDDSVEKIEVLKDWKACISEFPISLEVAHQAKLQGFHVVMGAPNLLLGGSHNNNLSSLEAIKAGEVDILCSDYYPGSLLQGIFYLYNLGFDMTETVKLATLNPAKALGISNEFGSIEIGKKADLLLIEEEQVGPKLHQTIVNGEPIYQINYRKNLKESIR